jgi:hypothetical protein
MAVFMSKRETEEYLRRDPDKFIRSLTPEDLSARRCCSPQVYLEMAVASASDFTDEEKKKINFLISKVSQYSFTWVFAKAYYEEGLPHTRQHIIFLSKPCSIRTLIHERVHVWQKKTGMRVLSPEYTQVSIPGVSKMRTNPDTNDGKVWSKNGIICGKFYNSCRPKSIMDCHQYERHPLEEEAYRIALTYGEGA